MPKFELVPVDDPNAESIALDGYEGPVHLDPMQEKKRIDPDDYLPRTEAEKRQVIEEREPGLEAPWIDPIDAVSGGFVGGVKSAGAKLGRKAMASGMKGAASTLATEPLAGGTMEAVDENLDGIPDVIKTPLGIGMGMGAGIAGEKLLSRFGKLLPDGRMMRKDGRAWPTMETAEEKASKLSEKGHAYKPAEADEGGGFILEPEEHLALDNVVKRGTPPDEPIRLSEVVKRGTPPGQPIELTDVIDRGWAPNPGLRAQLRGFVTRPLEVQTKEGDTRGSYLVRKFQDRFKRLKDYQQALGSGYVGGKVPEHSDAYLAEELFHGKVRNDLDELEKGRVEPLVKQMANEGVRPEHLNLYLYAKHAPERNAHIQKINPEFREKGIPGSGMSDRQASEVMRAFESRGLTPKYERAARKVWEMNNARIQMLRDSGMITEDMYQDMLREYRHYVPLKGQPDAPATLPGRRGGFDVRSHGVKRALGRKSMAEDPLTHSIAQFEDTLIRVRKNEVGQAFLNLARENPDPRLWEVNKAKLKGRFNPKTGEVEYVHTPPGAEKKKVLGVIEDGKHYYVEIKDPLLAKAMKNLGSEKSGVIVQGLSKLNRYLASVNTSLNPEFVLSNFSRDIQTAGINLSGERSAKLAGKVLKDTPKAMRAAYRGYRGKAAKGEWGRWFHEYRREGGAIGFFGLKDIETRANEIQKMLDRATPGRASAAKGAARKAGKLIMDVNAAVENAVRLSAYKNARESGMSPAQAASLSKNLTVNFNRKGEWGQVANALYLFYNAGMQGTARTVQALKNPRTRRITAGITSAAFGLTEMNRRIAGEDDYGTNYYDKIPDWEKERNIIIMRPGTEGKYLKVPLPYGYNVFHVLGEQMNTAMHRGEPIKGAVKTGRALINAFNPLGGEAGFLRMVSPTATDPALDIATNTDFAGRPIKPDQPAYGPGKPESELHWRSASRISKSVARAANKISGGNEIRPGMIDVSPEVLDHIARTVTGSAGAFLGRSLDYATDKITGEDTPAYKVPFARKFSGEPSEWADLREFRELKDELDRTYQEMRKGLVDRHDPAIKHKLRMHGIMGGAERVLRKHYRRRNAMIEHGADPERIREVDEQIWKIERRFLRDYKERKKSTN